MLRAALAGLWVVLICSRAGAQPAEPVAPSTAAVSGAAAAELGKLLYFDRRLSRDSSTSCATCHSPKLGWTDHRPTVLGIHEQLGERNAPTILNAARHKLLFWDGRAASLEEQSQEPIANPREMGFTLEEAAGRIGSIKGYEPFFRAAFGDDRATIGRIAVALAAFERTVTNDDSPYDRYLAGNKRALSKEARRGELLFRGKARCIQCHSGPDLSDGNFHNLGVGMQRRIQDLGRYAISKNDADRGAFKTPSLRNVADTYPYMHDGSLATLSDVVDYLDRGGFSNKWLTSQVSPLGLTASEKRSLVAFLESLSGDKRLVDEPKALPK